MAREKLHPSVEQFKSFVKQHPLLLKSVRGGENTWQDLYEDWFLLGPEDRKWEEFREGASLKTVDDAAEEKGWLNQFTGLLKNMDANQMQHHINSLSQAVGAIQGVLSQFQGQSQEPPKPSN